MKHYDPDRLECDTLYDSCCLKSIPKQDLCATASSCAKCGKDHLVLHHAEEEQFSPRTFIDVFVRCSVECDHFVRVRIRAK